jgi:transposase
MSKGTTSYTHTVGFDVSDKTAMIAVMDQAGRVCQEEQIELTLQAVRERFGRLPRSRVALEAGGQTRWLARVLGDLGHEVLVANPRNIPLLTKSHRKSDRADAVLLARMARLDPELLSPVTLRSEAAQEDLLEVRARDHAVRQRTRSIGLVRGQAKQFGARLPGCDADAFHHKAVEWLPAELLERLLPTIQLIEACTKTIKAYDRRLKQMLKRYPVAAALERQIRGVGPVTALAFVLLIDDPHRFTSRGAGAYLGLVPKKDQSGESDPQRGISKRGDALGRRLLVQCAQYMLGPFGEDSDLRRFGLRLAGSGNKAQRRRAVVAVARKLAVLMHALWVSGEVYEALRNSRVADAA